MSWQPTQQVIDVSPVIDNILAYIAANQGEANTWAFGNTVDDLHLYPNVTGRTATKFPQLIVIAHRHRGEAGETDNGDVLMITLETLFEVAVSGKDHTQLVIDARKYAHALESMLANITTEDISADISHAYVESYETSFDEIGQGGKSASSWLQIFQTRCEFKLIASAY